MAERLDVKLRQAGAARRPARAPRRRSAIFSASRRRATNASARADARSSHCASSTTQSSGCSSAASDSRLEDRQPDQERIRGRPGAQPERDGERVALRVAAGAPSSSRIGEHSCWSAANGELHLALDAGGAGDAEVRRRLDRVLEQGGLADARVAVHDQDAAVPAARGVQQPVEHLALALPAEQPLRRGALVTIARASMPLGRGLRISGMRPPGAAKPRCAAIAAAERSRSMSDAARRTIDTSDLPDYAPVPRSALGPALNEQGYYVGRVERNLYWVTDGTYQSAFLTTSDGVVLLDAPPTIGHNIQRAVDEIASANGVSNKVTHLIYSHHHADHVGASSLFDKNVTRIGHEETRRLLLRDDDPARPAERGDVPGSPHAGDRRRAHRPRLARRQPLAGQHHHPPARPRHADADRHRQPGLGAGLPLEPDRGHPRLHRGAGERARVPRGSTSSAATSAGSAPATMSTLHQQYMADIGESSRTAIDTVDPTPLLRQVRREHLGRREGLPGRDHGGRRGAGRSRSTPACWRRPTCSPRARRSG